MYHLQAPRCFGNECRPGGCGGNLGWTAEYTFVNGTCRPLVELFVTDLSEGGTYSGFLPFLVDTGASITVIPRTRLLPANAFRRSFDDRPLSVEHRYDIRGFSAEVLTGRRYLAGLSLTPKESPSCEALPFRQNIKVFVPDESRPIPHAFLGLDALRQIVSTFDHSCVVFRDPARHQVA